MTLYGHYIKYGLNNDDRIWARWMLGRVLLPSSLPQIAGNAVSVRGEYFFAPNPVRVPRSAVHAGC
jgi:hypothetical protein